MYPAIDIFEIPHIQEAIFRDRQRISIQDLKNLRLVDRKFARVVLRYLFVRLRIVSDMNHSAEGDSSYHDHHHQQQQGDHQEFGNQALRQTLQQNLQFVRSLRTDNNTLLQFVLQQPIQECCRLWRLESLVPKVYRTKSNSNNSPFYNSPPSSPFSSSPPNILFSDQFSGLNHDHQHGDKSVKDTTLAALIVQNPSLMRIGIGSMELSARLVKSLMVSMQLRELRLQRVVFSKVSLRYLLAKACTKLWFLEVTNCQYDVDMFRERSHGNNNNDNNDDEDANDNNDGGNWHEVETFGENIAVWKSGNIQTLIVDPILPTKLNHGCGNTNNSGMTEIQTRKPLEVLPGLLRAMNPYILQLSVSVERQVDLAILLLSLRDQSRALARIEISRFWRDNVADNNNDATNPVVDLRVLFRAAPQLTEIKVVGKLKLSGQFERFGFIPLLRTVLGLTSIELSQCDGLSEDEVHYFLKTCPFLVKFHVQDVIMNPKLTRGQPWQCLGIQSLRISRFDWRLDSVLAAASSALIQADAGNGMDQNDGVAENHHGPNVAATAAEVRPPSTYSWDFSHNPKPGLVFAQLSKLTKLKKLEIVMGTGISDQQDLEKRVIDPWSHVEEADDDEFFNDVQLLASCKQLTSLTLLHGAVASSHKIKTWCQQTWPRAAVDVRLV